MKYTVTSSEASKMLRKLYEEKEMIVDNERQSHVFHAALGEDVESVRPEYDYESVQKALDELDRKIRILKHAINCFNTTQMVGDTGMTIDQVLVYIPQLNAKRDKLYQMQSRLPKQRVSANGIGRNTVIDYLYANYSVGTAREDHNRVADELRKVQNALDVVNTTVTMEVELPD